MNGGEGDGDLCCRLSGMVAPLITSSSRRKNDRNPWIFLLHRTKEVVYESSIVFKIRSKDTREKPSERENSGRDHLLLFARSGCNFDHPQAQFLNKK